MSSALFFIRASLWLNKKKMYCLLPLIFFLVSLQNDLMSQKHRKPVSRNRPQGCQQPKHHSLQIQKYQHRETNSPFISLQKA